MNLNRELLPFLRDDQIITDSTDLERMSRSTLPEQTRPNLIVFPESTEEVQKIVRISNQHKIPLWYVSTGKNWGYGCKAAPYQGGITLILERMKKIIEVNEDLGYVVVEPGVTYSQLNSYLEKKTESVMDRFCRFYRERKCSRKCS
ncbi:MAG: FAD-dependent oxidoreductase [Bdellovibrionales bacterium]|nr:FAD-dependent oxidoreductase [Bdellovibrionales bacterium]